MTGYVYAIENAVGLVKIGWSTNPKRRLSKINSDTSSPCKLIGYVEGTLEQEATLHRLLRSEVEHGEWFRRGPGVEAFLKEMPEPSSPKMAQASAAPDADHAQIIDLWPKLSDFALDIGVAYGTAKAMRRRRSIPPEYWPQVVAASAGRNIPGITTDRLLVARSSRRVASEGAAA